MTKNLFAFFEPDKNGQHFWEKDIFGTETQASANTMAELCRHMSFMLDAGIAFESAISAMLSIKTKDKRLRISLQNALNDIMRGESVSSAFKNAKYFPSFVSSMCRIGEISDNMPQVMSLLADYYEESAKNREDIRSALMYPAIVAVMMLFMIVAAVVYVLPQYASVFAASDVELPLLTRVLLNLSDILITRWWVILPGLGAFILALSAFAKSTRGSLLVDYCKLYLPPISIVYRQMINLQIVQAMALLLQSHQHLVDSVLAVSSLIPNSHVAKDLEKLAAGLQEGKSFSTLIQEIPYIDQIITKIAVIGEETGNMAQAFNHASEYSRHKFKQMSQRLSKLVEPAITLVLGLALALVMLSIILPTFAMTEFVGY